MRRRRRGPPWSTRGFFQCSSCTALRWNRRRWSLSHNSGIGQNQSFHHHGGAAGRRCARRWSNRSASHGRTAHRRYQCRYGGRSILGGLYARSLSRLASGSFWYTHTLRWVGPSCRAGGFRWKSSRRPRSLRPGWVRYHGLTRYYRRSNSHGASDWHASRLYGHFSHE